MTTMRIPPPRRGTRSRGPSAPPWVAVLLVLVGVIVLLYPVLATQFNNAHQREFASEYNREVEQVAPHDLADDLERARAYNATLTGVPILDPWLVRVSGDPNSPAYREYLGELARFSVMGRVRVPSAMIDLPIAHGTSDEVIARGAGHLYGTALPVGGKGTHAVLTSHTGMATATLFDHLTDVREGDLMFLDVNGKTLAYEVDQITVVLPNQIDDLKVVKGKDLLTLFTCTPYGINTHRLLVRGHRVPFVPEVAAAELQTSGPVLEPWMYGLLGCAGVGAMVLLVIVWRELVKGRRARKTPSSRRRVAQADDGVSGMRRLEA